MAVVLSEIIKDQAQHDGRRKIKYRYTFHTAEKRELDRGLQPAEFDASTDLTAQVQSIEEAMAESEVMNMIADSEQAYTDLTGVLPEHPFVDGESDFDRRKRLFRAVIKHFYNQRKSLNLYVIRMVALPVWLWIRQAAIDNTWTNAQVANYLGWTVSQLAAVDNWFTQLESALTFIDFWFDDENPEV